ncbi:MAG: TIGR04053 family radical SAM/SPASM domain-containing protein [Candidatus Binatia bacterium]
MLSVSPSIPPVRARPLASRDFGAGPLVVFYETTQACDLVCTHCRASAQPNRNRWELTPAQACGLLDELCRFDEPPLVVLTGGDPMKRPDIHEIVEHGVSRGLSMSMTPSATPLVTKAALGRLADAGLSRLAVSIDGANAASHDALRGVPGSFARSLEILADARACGLSLQVNTTVHRGNVDELPALADLLDGYGIVLWSVFFLVPVGRGLAERRIDPERYEEVFALLAREARRRSYLIKTTEAPHYRRFVLQKRKAARRRERGLAATNVAGKATANGPDTNAATGVVPMGMAGTNDGNGVLFIGHTGLIQPSGFLPRPCGRFPHDSIVEVYRNHPLFRSLRDADGFRGKCGSCEFRSICGGSRARTFALTGDALGSDPDCVYQPAAWLRASQHVADAPHGRN